MEKLVQTMVLIPTFNEAKNIEALICEILSTRKEIEVLVVDDNSPDGTAALAEKSFKQTREFICS
jgi:dolichol-phosphate mannosyltransferase